MLGVIVTITDVIITITVLMNTTISLINLTLVKMLLANLLLMWYKNSIKCWICKKQYKKEDVQVKYDFCKK